MKNYFEIFSRFLWLGLLSFGGPAAHIGYFHRVFVKQLQWLTDQDYQQLVALSQFLPGPASSQVGFAIGIQKAGIVGGLMAFIGFTLPSFFIMFGLSVWAIHDGMVFTAIINGLKLLAVAVVADAVWTMGRRFCRDLHLLLIAVATALALTVYPSMTTQMSALVLAGIATIAATLWRPALTSSVPPRELKPFQDKSNKQSIAAIAIFISLFVISTLTLFSTPFAQTFSSFYQAGSLVFGGGHVVLPLLQQSVGQSLESNQFLLGYAAAQAIPGPMFTLSSYLGAELHPQYPLLGALIATLALFLPGFLLIIAAHQHWQKWMAIPSLSAAIAGINAAVVGLLAHALYHPVLTSAVHQVSDLVIAMLGFLILRRFQPNIMWLALSFCCYAMIKTSLMEQAQSGLF